MLESAKLCRGLHRIRRDASILCAVRVTQASLLLLIKPNTISHNTYLYAYVGVDQYTFNSYHVPSHSTLVSYYHRQYVSWCAFVVLPIAQDMPS